MAERSRLGRLPGEVAGRLSSVLTEIVPSLDVREVGTVTRVARGVAHVAGFTDVGANEQIHFEAGIEGLATSLALQETGVVLLGSGHTLRPGANAFRTHRALSTLGGEALLGRVVDPLGRPLDGGPPIVRPSRCRVDSRAPDIIERAPVVEPVQTGIKSIDATVPIGRGQRELILGDRQTGKTAIAVATLINQRGSGLVCIYCAIGQRAAATARVICTLKEAGVAQETIVVATTGDDPPGLQFVAPYAATAMAEWFMRRGRDVVIVYDDLTRHARAYRELSLLLRRPPGREAYPGDIFYVHSRLLERAAKLRPGCGGGSITALPIVETQAGNISAFIPTNLISITDGQIFLSSELFQKGVLPAIDIGRSVSRIGGKAQLPSYRVVAQSLRLAYSQFEEVEAFARFATRLDEETRHSVERGRRVREILKQGETDLLAVPEQVAVLLAVTTGVFDAVPVERMQMAEERVRRTLRDDDACWAALASRAPLSAEMRQHTTELARQAIAGLDD